MASFTSYVKADSRLYATVSFSIKEKSYDVSTNTSVVEYSFSGAQVSPSYFAFSGTSRNPAGTVVVKINGSDVKSANIALLRYAQGTCSGSGTVTVPHNNDGTKTVSWSIRMDEVTGNYSGDTWKYGATSTSGSLKLTDIPRATAPTLSKTSADMGTSVTITTTPAVSTFQHILYYQIGSGSWTAIGTHLTSTTTTWTIPLNLASKVPNGTSLPLTIWCETYNGDTHIGTKSVSLTATVPSSVVPSISSITVSESGTDVPSSFGRFVKSKSKLKIVTSASGSYGSTISNYTVEYLGTVYSGSSVTTGVINKSGSTSVKVTVTDSRGRKASRTKLIEVVDYNSPSLWGISVNRAKSDGTIADDGIYANITYAYSISSVNSKNAKSFKIEWSADQRSWKTLLSNTSDYSKDTSVTPSTSFDSDSKFYFRFTISDSFSTASKILTMTETYSLIDWDFSGKGMGFFGKPSKGNNTLEIFGKTEIQDYVQVPKIIGGYYQHYINSDGKSGYFNIAQINIIRTYFNYPIEFTIARRNDTTPTRISIRFQNAGNLEPTLNSFITDGYTNDVYIVKASTSVWNLYVKKSEAWDSIAILDCKFNHEYCGDCVTYKSSQATSLPSGYKQANAKDDTGWVDCTITNSSVSRYGNSADNAPLQVRRIGKIVHLRGCLKNSAVIADATDLAKIPSGFAPTYTEVYVEQGSGTNRFCMRVKSTGVISVERYSNGTSATSIPNGSWINLFATWFVD